MLIERRRRLRHVALVAKFPVENKPKMSLKKSEFGPQGTHTNCVTVVMFKYLEEMYGDIEKVHIIEI